MSNGELIILSLKKQRLAPDSEYNKPDDMGDGGKGQEGVHNFPCKRHGEQRSTENNEGDAGDVERAVAITGKSGKKLEAVKAVANDGGQNKKRDTA